MSRIEIRIALVLSLLVAGVSPAQADSVLSGLSIIESQITKGRAPKTGYTRAQFGQTWADVDRNGCDTRNDILKRDLTAEVFKERTRECVVLSGTLIDPFSGRSSTLFGEMSAAWRFKLTMLSPYPTPGRQGRSNYQ